MKNIPQEDSSKQFVLEIIKQEQAQFADEPTSVQYRFCTACRSACEQGGISGLTQFLTHMQNGKLTFRDIEYLEGIDRRKALRRMGGFALLAGIGFGVGKSIPNKNAVVGTGTFLAQLVGCLGVMQPLVRYKSGYENFDEAFAAYVKSPELERDMNLTMAHLRTHHSDVYPEGLGR